MGKGISKLQLDLLKLAYNNIEYMARSHNGVQAYGFEAMLILFNFKENFTYYSFVYEERTPLHLISPGSHHFRLFDGEEKRKYNSAKASLSRAILRLQRRELITVYTGKISHWHGYSLTDKGIKELEKHGLTVNQMAGLPKMDKHENVMVNSWAKLAKSKPLKEVLE